MGLTVAVTALCCCSVCGQVSGGYGGVMEAVSAGAAGVSGASIEGIISPAAFPFQGEQGNRHLTHRTYTTDLPHRLITFLARCQAFVVLPGGLGTLTELCLTWNVSAISDLQPPHNRRPLCLLVDRQPWQAVIEHCTHLLPITDQFMAHLTYVDSIDDILQRLTQARSEQQQVAGSQSAPPAARDGAARQLTADEKSYG